MSASPELETTHTPHLTKSERLMPDLAGNVRYYPELGGIIPLSEKGSGGKSFREARKELMSLRKEYRKLSPESIEHARETLLSIPLIHRTWHKRFSGDEYDGESLYDSPVPYAVLADTRANVPNNTYGLDSELGLDEYVFMSWGSALDNPKEDIGFLKQAPYGVLIDPELLLDERAVASPEDLAEHVTGRALATGDFFKPWWKNPPLIDSLLRDREYEYNSRGLLQYRQSILSGRDWLEVNSKRLALAISKGEKLNISSGSLGEIKFKGPIPESSILGVVRLDTDEYDALEQHIEELSGDTIDTRGRRDNSLLKRIGKKVVAGLN